MMSKVTKIMEAYDSVLKTGKVDPTLAKSLGIHVNGGGRNNSSPPVKLNLANNATDKSKATAKATADCGPTPTATTSTTTTTPAVFMAAVEATPNMSMSRA